MVFQYFGILMKNIQSKCENRSGFTLVDPGRQLRGDNNVQGKAGRAGFTLVEILIVVLISSMLMGLVIIYSGVGRDETALSVGSTAIAQSILRAKSLAISTYSRVNGQHVCAYGVSFNRVTSKYSIFGYSQPRCPSADVVASSGISTDDMVPYSDQTWNVTLGQGLHFAATGTSGPTLDLVLFYPPDPTTLVSTGGCAGVSPCIYSVSSASGSVSIVGATGGIPRQILVSAAGQVNF